MNLFHLARRNLALRPARTGLTIAGVALSVAVLTGLLGFQRGYRESLHRNVEQLGFQLLLTAKGCPYEAATLLLKGGGGLQYLDEGVVEHVQNDPRVAATVPHLVQTVFNPLTGPQGGVLLLLGVGERYFELKPWATFREGGPFHGPEAREVILGSEVARLEARGVDERFLIPELQESYRIVGVLEESGTQEDGIVFLPLRRLQLDFEVRGRLTGIGVKLHDLEKLDDFAEDMERIPDLQVISLAQVRNTLLGFVRDARRLVLAIAIVAVAIAGLGLVNTMLLATSERRAEIGVLRTLGASRGEVFLEVCSEAMLLCAAGGLLGIAAAVLGGDLLETALRGALPFAPVGSLIHVDTGLGLLSLLGTLGVGVVAALYPAWLASRIEPAEAVRTAD